MYDGGGILGKTPLAAATIRLAAIALAVLFIAQMGATSASAQQLNACSNGIAVTDPSDNPGLVQDCQTLLTLKDALAGDAQLNWSADSAIDTWRGVAVSGSPARVTGISLANGGLTGVIPAQLGSLPSLTTLYLHRNQLTGAIPSELGGLSNLQGLYIQRNQLTGEIPAQLGDLSNLTRLYLINNGFTGCIPAALRDVRHSDVRSAGLPFCAENTPAPTPEPEQDSGCSNGIMVPNPEDNPGLVQDCEILVSAKYYPPDADFEIGNSYSISIEGTPPRVTKIDFSLFGGKDGPIPPQLGNLSNLERLVLVPRNFDNPYWDPNASGKNGSIPSELGNLSNLKVLEIYADLKGPIPPELGNLANLERLVLRNSNLTGPIPPELGNLSNLEHLSLSYNRLTGPIPPEFGNLSNLKGLYLEYNRRLTGPIPPELGNLTKLKYLTLPSQLTGPIPPELGNLTNLEYLTLPEQLTGCVPTALRDVVSPRLPPRLCPDDKYALTAFYNATGGKDWTHNDNWLSDEPLGEWHGVTTDADGRVTALSLRDNNLVGEIPDVLVHLHKLEVLALDGNNLGGEIPIELGYLSNLTRLALNRNNLEGEIPDSLQNLTNLSVLGLARNEQLRRGLPAWIGSLSNLTKLSLHDTGLSGRLPTELTDLNLSRLAIRNTYLCVPPTAYYAYYDFMAWLAGIEDTDFGDDGPAIC